ncbi:flagellar filament capping protein FliD [Lysobacter humi (ex Lee et al. 2017)]
MAISSPGVGSGLDVNSLVSQLVAAERAPTDARFARIEKTTQAQISAFGALKGAMSGLESVLKRFEGAGSTLGRKTGVAADAGYTASAAATASIGKYQVSVERLATAQKLQSAPVAAATQVGHGTLEIRIGSGDPIRVTVEPGKGTLSDIRDAINKASGNQLGATVVRGDAGDVLMLASNKVGTAGTLAITASGGDGGLAVLATPGGTMTETVQARDAQVIVDGVTRTVTSNTLTDVIDGVTLNLTKADPGKTFQLEVAGDTSPLKASVLSFISAYNVALSQLRTQGAAGGEGKVAGPLSGDPAPRSITQNLRNAVVSSYDALTALGVKSSVEGSLSLDGAKFDAAMAADPAAVRKLLGDDSSLGATMRSLAKNYGGDKGLLEGRSSALTSRMKSLSTEKLNFEKRIEGFEAAYRRQFTQLDTLVSKMQSMSSYLTQQIAALPKSS